MFFDFIGQKLEIGDIVICTTTQNTKPYNELHLMQVHKFTKDNVVVRHYGKRSISLYNHPKSLFKINPEHYPELFV